MIGRFDTIQKHDTWQIKPKYKKHTFITLSESPEKILQTFVVNRI